MPKILHISGSKVVSWYDFILAFAEAKELQDVFIRKFKKQRFETNGFMAERPKKAGLNVDLSKRLGLPQFDYLDGMELI